MASLGDLTIRLDLDNTNFTRGMSRMQGQLNNVSSTVNRGTTGAFGGLNSMLGNVSGSVSGLGASLATGIATGGTAIAIEGLTKAFTALGGAVKNVISDGIKYNATMESNTVAFEVLLGSADKAEKMMSDISKFAEVTPFATEDLVQGAKVMKSFGIETEKLMPNLQMLGDVALGDSEKMKSLTLAFAQVSAGGKLTGGDLLQFINAGFNPLQVISEKTGKSMADLRDQMSQGGISAEMVSMAFQSATSEGGMFYQGMDKLGGSFEGRMSTLEDTMTSLKGKITKPFFDFLSSNVLPKIQGLLEKFGEKLPSIMETIGTIYDNHLKPIFEAIGGLFTELFTEGMQGFNSFKNALSSISGILIWIWENFKTVFLNVIEIMKTVWSVTLDLAQIFYDVFAVIFYIITGRFGEAKETGIKIWNNFKSIFFKIWKLIGKMISNTVKGFVNILKGFGIDGVAIFKNLANKVKDVFNWIIEKYEMIRKKIQEFTKVEIGGQTIFEGTMFEQTLPKVSFEGIELPKLSKIETEDFGQSLIDGFNNLFGLNDALNENTEAVDENVESKEEAVNWQEKFNNLMKEGTPEAKKQAKAIKSVADTIKELGKTLSDSAKSFANFVDVFGKVSRVRVSANSLFNRLRGQVREMQKWRENLLELGKKLGTGSALFQELASKGAGASGEITALNRMSEERLQEYKAMFGTKQAIGLEVAGVQQAGAMGITQAITINITGNNINDAMDLEILANRMAKELTLAGVN